ncbi:ATP-dependent zinc metalloprotease FtsH [Chelativorans alearense]|uniref:ATP-dependent zinc metalloprotease FtsH n=1 Tax=Chelativorans alearense TaxID=2681495 RepID=UPI0013D586CA|nr:ATP-dependent zinc metalloprotease FtsH [Chelativorans alearense]
MDKQTRFNLWYILAAFLIFTVLQLLWSQASHVTTVPYSEFESLLKDGRISEVVITSQQVQGALKDAPEGQPQHVVATRVDPALASRLDQYGVPFSAAIESTFLRDLLSWMIPIALFFGIWMFVFRRIAERQGLGGMMSIGKSKAKVYVETDIKVSFNDVAGVDEAKGELQEIVDFLKDPPRHSRLGARMPKGILLVGPPGTGKTLLARAVAGEAGVPFFSIGGSEFVELFVGVGAARVRDLFEQARKAAPAIIFIDELDALGRARGAFPWGGGHDEKEQTLNQLLSEMDGFDPREGVILLAATNRPEILDPALLRAGRFDRQVLVDRPDKIGRAQILRVHANKISLAPDADLDQIAAMTPGFSGADLANLVNEATLLATRRGGESVTMADFTRAIERIVAGLEKKSRILNPHEREVVAYHELGHAFVAMALPGSDAVHKVSIIPRGVGALGYTIQRPTEDRYLMTRKELEDRMAVLLGGRAAENIVFGEVSTGAADDLVKATDIARSMVTRFGMAEGLGPIAYEDEPNRFLGTAPMPGMLERRYSESTTQRIDDAVRDLVNAALERAASLLKERRELLDKVAKALLARETLTGEELKAFFSDAEDGAGRSAVSSTQSAA